MMHALSQTTVQINLWPPAQVDEDDRPLQPPVVLGAEVLWNPFEDIVPRSMREDREAAALRRGTSWLLGNHTM